MTYYIYDILSFKDIFISLDFSKTFFFNFQI